MAAWLPILTFHDIDDHPSVISTPRSLFRRAMARLNERGYRTLTLLEAADYLRRGEPFPSRYLVITFDDGYQSAYNEVFPVLRRYGMSATVFLAVGESAGREHRVQLPPFDGREMLTWSQIREMHAWGVAFGAHTLTHPDLTCLSDGRVEKEVRDSKAIIEDNLGSSVLSFAYPKGRYDDRVRGTVQQHFLCACSDKLGLLTQRSDPYALQRVDAYYLRTDRSLGLMFTSLFPWYISLRSGPRRTRRALQLRRK